MSCSNDPAANIHADGSEEEAVEHATAAETVGGIAGGIGAILDTLAD